MIQSDGELLVQKTPSAEEIETYHTLGLAALAREEVNIEYSKDWDMEDIDRWIRSLFPKVFQWLDIRWGVPDSGEIHWVLLQRSRQKLFTLTRPQMSGEDLHNAKGSPGRAWRDHAIYIGTPQCLCDSHIPDGVHLSTTSCNSS